MVTGSESGEDDFDSTAHAHAGGEWTNQDHGQPEARALAWRV